MRKDISLLEAMKLTGKHAYELIGVNRETKQWIKRSVNTVVGSNVLVQTIEEVKVQEVVIEEPMVEMVPITKPSDRFNVEDYLRYKEYVLERGGKPSIEDYFIAVEYYKNGGR